MARWIKVGLLTLLAVVLPIALAQAARRFVRSRPPDARAIDAHPPERRSYATDLRARAEAAMATRDWAEALQLWIQVIGLNPDDAQAYSQMGTAYVSLGDLEGARECYEAAHQLDEGNALYRGQLASLRR